MSLTNEEKGYDRIDDSYHADHESTLNYVTVCSDDTGWTDTRPVNT